jgi:hypothetical protein
MPLPIDDIICLSTVTEADKTRCKMANKKSVFVKTMLKQPIAFHGAKQECGKLNIPVT